VSVKSKQPQERLSPEQIKVMPEIAHTNDWAKIAQRGLDSLKELFERNVEVKTRDGFSVSFRNPNYMDVGKFLKHLCSHNTDYKDPFTGKEFSRGAFAESKAKLVPLMRTTLENAQLRLLDPDTKNVLYVAKYPDGTTHGVLVTPNGSVENHEAFEGYITTQFDPLASNGRSRYFTVSRDLANEIATGRIGQPGAANAFSGEAPASVAGQPPAPQVRVGVSHRKIRRQGGRQLQFTSDAVTEVSADQDAAASSSRDIAAQNAVNDALRTMYDTDKKLLSWRPRVLSAARVRENWFFSFTGHKATLSTPYYGGNGHFAAIFRGTSNRPRKTRSELFQQNHMLRRAPIGVSPDISQSARIADSVERRSVTGFGRPSAKSRSQTGAPYQRV
jgi:hypothetical protein